MFVKQLLCEAKAKEIFLIKFVLVVVLLCFNYKHLIMFLDQSRVRESEITQNTCQRTHSFTENMKPVIMRHKS